MNNALKVGLAVGGGYLIYKGYQLYRLSNEIKYTPVSLNYARGVIQVKMKLDNPADITLKMKGVDGTIFVKDPSNIIAMFTSDAFTIQRGTSFFTLNFKLDVANAGMQLVNLLISKNIPDLKMTLNKRLEFMTQSETFNLNNL